MTKHEVKIIAEEITLRKLQLPKRLARNISMKAAMKSITFEQEILSALRLVYEPTTNDPPKTSQKDYSKLRREFADLKQHKRKRRDFVDSLCRQHLQRDVATMLAVTERTIYNILNTRTGE